MQHSIRETGDTAPVLLAKVDHLNGSNDRIIIAVTDIGN